MIYGIIACAAFEFIVICLLLRHVSRLSNYIMASRDIAAFNTADPPKYKPSAEDIKQALERKEYDEFVNILMSGTVNDEQETKYAAPDMAIS